VAKSKTILVTGAYGLIGKALCTALYRHGYTVRKLSRSHGDCKWDINSGYIDTNTLNGISCAVHLAGEPIDQRWTPDAKERIRKSRVKSTQMLVKEILRQRHSVDLICASGINYYGYDTLGPLTEQSAPGSGFLAEVCQEWERSAAGAGLTPKLIRTGVVLSKEGGALKKMLPPFKAGLGGPIGSGEQMMSWISLEDIVRVYIRAIEDDSLTGAINAVALHPVSNSNFTKALGKALKRPAILPLPAFMVNLLFGEMSRETILSDLNVMPEKLQQCGFEWKQPDLDSALRRNGFVY